MRAVRRHLAGHFSEQMRAGMLATRRQDVNAPAALLRNHAHRHVPGMQIDPQPIDLDHRIASGQVLRFLH